MLELVSTGLVSEILLTNNEHPDVHVRSWLLLLNMVYFCCLPAASMTALIVTACIIWCVCSAKSNRQKDGFHRLRQHREDYDDEIHLTSMGSKKSLLSHEFQDDSESEEDTLYANKI